MTWIKSNLGIIALVVAVATLGMVFYHHHVDGKVEVGA